MNGVPFEAELFKWKHIAVNKYNVIKSHFSFCAKLVQQPSLSTENVSEAVNEERSTVKLVISGLAISEIFYIQPSYMHRYSREGEEGRKICALLKSHVRQFIRVLLIYHCKRDNNLRFYTTKSSGILCNQLTLSPH